MAKVGIVMGSGSDMPVMACLLYTSDAADDR